jgi:hypothetical protein
VRRRPALRAGGFFLGLMGFGVFVIIPVGMILINTGLPGFMFVYDGSPSITTIFEFPIAWAPTVVVPLFIVMQVFAILIEMNVIKGDDSGVLSKN